MTKTYTIDVSEQILIVRFLQQPEVIDTCHAIDEAAAIQPNNLRLYDLSNSGLTLNSNQLREIAIYGKQKFLSPAKIAIVAPKDLEFGLSSMFEVYREQEQTEVKVFRTEAEALEWLKNQP